MSGLQKNVASQKWRVFAFNTTTGAAVTGDAANITAKIAKDWGTATASNDTNPTEVEDGYYLFDLTQAESNADVLDFYPESSTANVQVIGSPGTIFTVAENFQALGIETDGDLTKVNTLDGHTPQTADHTTGIADIPTGAEFEARTLLAASYFDPATDPIPWNSAWDAEVESECNDALVAQKLDHLVAVADADDPVDNSIVAKLAASDGDWSGFAEANHSLEAIRDRGDAAWTTGAGGTPPHLLQSTTIATLASQTSFTLTAGSADDDAYNNAIVVVTDQSTSTQKAVGTISDYTGASKTVTLSADPGVFTMAVGDTIDVMSALGSAGSAPTVEEIRIEIDANSTQLTAIVADTNELQADWANGGRLDLIIDAILADTNELQGDDVPGLIGALNDPTAIAIADELLTRDWNSVSGEAARSVLNALRFLRNKWSIAGTTLTVTQEDDSTEAWTATVSTDAAAEPITGNDPAGP